MIDSVGLKRNEFGIFVDIPNYDLGMPASGILIWHIDEEKIQQNFSSFNISEIKKQISFSSSIIKTLYIRILKNN